MTEVRNAILQNIPSGRTQFHSALKRYRSQHHCIEPDEEWGSKGGRPIHFPRSLIIQTILDDFKDNGEAMSDHNLRKNIIRTGEKLTGKKMSLPTVSRISREIISYPDVVKLRNTTYKKHTRYISEHSCRSSIAYSVAVATTHWFRGTPIADLHADCDKLGEDAKICYDIVKQLHDNKDIIHVLPGLLTSSDDTTIFVTTKRIDNDQHWFLTLKPKCEDEKYDKQDEATRASFTTTPISDMAFRGFRITMTKTINADGKVAPGFVILSGLNRDSMPLNSTRDIEYTEIETLKSEEYDCPGYMVFVRKEDKTGEQQQSVSGEQGNSNDDDEMGNLNLSLPLQQQLSELYRKKVYRPWIRAIRMKDYGWDGTSDIPEHLRAVSWQDGASGQLNYLCREDVMAIEEQLKISVNKHSSARSGMEQACDVAPIFRRLKELIRNMMYERKSKHQCWRMRHIHEQIDNLPLNLPSWKKNLCVDVIRCFPELVKEACTVHNVRKGFLNNGQICSHQEPVPNFLGMLNTRRVPYFDFGISKENKLHHCQQLIQWFGPLVLSEGYIKEQYFCEYNIVKDRNEEGNIVEKTATISCESQQRAKHLSNAETRHARQMLQYERVLAKYNKVLKQQEEETTVLTRGKNAEIQILKCIEHVLESSSPTLEMMTLATLGERGSNARNGIPFPTGKVLFDFLRSRHSPTVAEKSGAIHYYSKPTGTKRDFLCEQCVIYRSAPMFTKQVCLPDMPSQPLPPARATNQEERTNIRMDREERVILEDSSTDRNNGSIEHEL